jgi:mRNA interferase RelE/StbE
LTFSVFLHPRASDELNRLDETIAQRIKIQLRELKDDPDKKGAKLRYTDYWRMRIGDYRAIYEIDYQEKRVIVLYIGHRKNVYDDFSKVI